MTSIIVDHRKTAPSVPPEGDEDGPLYESRRRIHTIAVKGLFRRIKWALLILTLGIYYFLPLVRWDRGPGAPDQAVLIDFPARRFYFFFIEIWPQEVYYLTGLLILASLALFLMNAVAGRLWCGYLCPQTVWTDLFMAVERWVEGDRRAQTALDNAPWSLDKLRKRVTKHVIWLMIAWWTGGAWVLYFSDAPTLVYDLATLNAPMAAYIWIGILTASTYFLAGHLREQVCIYMCPWPRIQAALTDEYALNVTYRYDRGEPRLSLKKSDAARAAGQPAGDCVDCGQCVAACPTGVDIRNGLQLDCIQCGLCIDACDTVMKKVDRPTGLIGYDTDINVKARACGSPPQKNRIIRPRTLLYAALIVFVGGVMLTALLSRTSTGLNVIHDRNPLFVKLADGGIRNGYTLRIVNKQMTEDRFEITVTGLDEAKVEVIGATIVDGHPQVVVGPDQTAQIRMIVSVPGGVEVDQSQDIAVAIKSKNSGVVASVADHFRADDEDD